MSEYKKIRETFRHTGFILKEFSNKYQSEKQSNFLQRSHSFDTLQISILTQYTKIQHNSHILKKQTTLQSQSNQHCNHLFRKQSKIIQDEQINHKQEHTQVNEGIQKLRGMTQYEQINDKQKRLNQIVPWVFVFQHSNEAAILKKKKLNRIKMHYKLQKKKRQITEQQRSKSLPLPPRTTITHKRSQTKIVYHYSGPILNLDADLVKRISALCYKKRASLVLGLRRRTLFQEPRNSFCISKDKLIRFQEAMAQQFDQIDISAEHSPMLPLSKTNRNSSPIHHLNPWIYSEASYNTLFTRRNSRNIVADYVKNKNSQIESSKNSFVKFPEIQSPSLTDYNKHYLQQKIQKKKYQVIHSNTTQINHALRSFGFINQKTSVITQNAKQSKIFNAAFSLQRVKTLQTDFIRCKNKNNLQQKLKPYLK